MTTPLLHPKKRIIQDPEDMVDTFVTALSHLSTSALPGSDVPDSQLTTDSGCCLDDDWIGTKSQREDRCFLPPPPPPPPSPLYSLKNPLYPEYQSMTQRLKSFDRYWPRQLSQTPYQLAWAGFFYTQTSDKVKCYCCGVTLHQWESTDVPWEEHLIHHTRPCEFLRCHCPSTILYKFKNFPKQWSFDSTTSRCQHDAPRCLRMLQEPGGSLFCTACGHYCGKGPVDTV